MKLWFQNFRAFVFIVIGHIYDDVVTQQLLWVQIHIEIFIQKLLHVGDCKCRAISGLAHFRI
jgi:hypothetical protein